MTRPETGSSSVALLTESLTLFLCVTDFTLTQTIEEFKNLLSLLASDLLASDLLFSPFSIISSMVANS